MTSRILFNLLLVVAFGAFSSSVVSHADMIGYGNFAGDNVEFQMVTEISGDLPDGGLYGTPSVIGDSLNFLTPGFISQSESGDLDFLDGRLTFMVEAFDENRPIVSIDLFEFGSFFNFGDDSLSLVEAIAFVQVDGELLSGDFLQQFGGGVPNSGDWNGGLTIVLPEPATKITFTMDNRLFTSADADGVAFIDKKGLRITANVIPEPATGFVGGIIICASLLRRRRK